MNAPFFPSSRPNISVRAQVRIPATMVGAGGIGVNKENGIWTIEPQWEDLVLLAPGIALNPSTKEIWVRDTVSGIYNRLSLLGLGEAIWSGLSITANTIGSGSKSWTTTPGKDWPIGSYVMAIASAVPTNWMLGQVTGYDSAGVLTLNIPVGSTQGAGAFNAWLLIKSSPGGSGGGGGGPGADGQSAGLNYNFSTSTSGDPGVGKVGFNSLTVGAISQIRINHTDRNAASLAAEIATWDDSSTTVNYARVRVYSPTDPTKFVIASIIGTQINNGTWSAFTLGSPTGPGGIVDASFAQVEVFRTGDKGADGAAGADGNDGAPGATGPQGDPGATGPAGTNGTNGTNGVDGISAGFHYTYTASTASPVSSGQVGINNATASAATAVHLAKVDAVAQNLSAEISTWDDSTNLTNRGTIQIEQTGTPVNFLIYQINGAITDAGASYVIPVTFITQGTSAPGTTTAVQVIFTRAGDKGAAGAGSGDMLAANNLSDLVNKATSRTNLGVAIGTDVQGFDAQLAAIAALAPAADQFPYFTALTTAALATVTAFARTLLDDVDAATMRATLGLVIGTNVQGQDAELAALASTVSAANKLPYYTGSGTATTTDLTAYARTLLAAVDAAAALGLIGGQPLDAELSALASVTSAADKLPYFTGVGTATVTDLTAFARTLLDDVDAAAMRTTIGAQAADAKLTAVTTLGNWKVVYTDASGVLIPVALATAGFALVSNGAAVAPSFQEVLRPGVTANLTVGYTFTANGSIGTVTSGTVTPNPALSNYQFYTNNGAHTLAAPTVDCAIDLLITNGASAGAITFTGYQVKSGGTGDALTTVNGDDFLISIRRINSIATYTIKALQ